MIIIVVKNILQIKFAKHFGEKDKPLEGKDSGKLKNKRERKITGCLSLITNVASLFNTSYSSSSTRCKF